MKCTSIVYSVLLIFTCIGCSKKSDKTPNAEGNWFLANEAYKVDYAVRKTYNNYFVLSCFDSYSNTNTLDIYFPSVPSASSKYKVVEFENDTPLGLHELGFRGKVIVYNQSPNIEYSSTGRTYGSNPNWPPADSVEVTVSNGKIKIDIPEMVALVEAPRFIDSPSVKASIIEK